MISMRAQAILLFCSVVVFASGCDQAGTSKSYKGTATTTIEYLEYGANNTFIFIEQKKFSKAVQVLIGPPKSVGLIVEENPFALSITTEPTTGEEGELWVTSSVVLVDPILGEVLLEYWTLEINGTAATGTLSDTHIAEAAAMNQLWAQDEVAKDLIMTMPFCIDKGATLQGTITEQEVRLHIAGTSTDQRRPFTAEIVASREH